MIDTVDMTKKSVDKTEINDLTIRLNEGKAVGFLGPNGTGKIILLLGWLIVPPFSAIYISYEIKFETLDTIYLIVISAIFLAAEPVSLYMCRARFQKEEY
jgi:ABC-type enterochelin transport system ATPase subunit